jgi:methionine aminopeptidase
MVWPTSGSCGSATLSVDGHYHGCVGDTARTVAVGGRGVAAQRLMDITEKALYEESPKRCRATA